MQTENTITSNQAAELDLYELFKIIWFHKILVAIGTAIFAVFSVFYALSLPNIYESESVLSAVEQGSNENSPFGGLASMVGISLSGESSKRIDVTMETAKSVDFYVYLNQKRNIDKFLTAIEVYSYGEDKLYFNEEIYDSSENKWVVDENGQDSKPSILEGHKELHELFDFGQDKVTGLVQFKFRHQSPHIAKQILDFIVVDLNEYVRERELLDAKKSIEYLTIQISKTSLPEVRRALSNLIEQQTQKAMVGETTDEYALKIIQSPIQPEDPSYPSRRTICIVITLLGILLSSIFVLIFNQIKYREN